MNDDFRTIYRILKVLDASLDYEAVDPERISPEALGTTKARRDNLLAMMAEEGLVKGITIRHYKDAAGRTVLVDPAKLSITLKGVEFLKENSMMKKAADAAKGIVDALL